MLSDAVRSKSALLLCSIIGKREGFALTQHGTESAKCQQLIEHDYRPDVSCSADQWMCCGQCGGRKGPLALLFMKMKYLYFLFLDAQVL